MKCFVTTFPTDKRRQKWNKEIGYRQSKSVSLYYRPEAQKDQSGQTQVPCHNPRFPELDKLRNRIQVSTGYGLRIVTTGYSILMTGYPIAETTQVARGKPGYDDLALFF